MRVVSVEYNTVHLDDETPPASDGAKPTFTERPMIKQSDDGSKITFECRLVADPEPKIEWYHKTTLVKEDSRHAYKMVSDKYNRLASLIISDVKSSDGGLYKVVARNKHGEGNATIDLNFDEGKPNVPDAQAPRFPKKPTIRQKGTILILECILEANPYPEITWYLGTKVIKDDSRHKMTKQETGLNTYLLGLEISEPTLDDGGTYRCNAINEKGESNANIALNFQSNDALRKVWFFNNFD